MAVTAPGDCLDELRMPKNFKQAMPMLLCFSSGGIVGLIGNGNSTGGGISEDIFSMPEIQIDWDDTGLGQMMCFGPV